MRKFLSQQIEKASCRVIVERVRQSLMAVGYEPTSTTLESYLLYAEQEWLKLEQDFPALQSLLGHVDHLPLAEQWVFVTSLPSLLTTHDHLYLLVTQDYHYLIPTNSFNEAVTTAKSIQRVEGTESGELFSISLKSNLCVMRLGDWEQLSDMIEQVKRLV